MKNNQISDPIAEARRYVANAEETIGKAKYDPETKSYTDNKYVRTAGNILWNGCLIALESVFHLRKGKGRPSIDKYREAAAKRDGKLLRFMNYGYDVLHLSMGYVWKAKRSATPVSRSQTTSSTTARRCCRSRCVRERGAQGSSVSGAGSTTGAGSSTTGCSVPSSVVPSFSARSCS